MDGVDRTHLTRADAQGCCGRRPQDQSSALGGCSGAQWERGEGRKEVSVFYTVIYSYVTLALIINAGT